MDDRIKWVDVEQTIWWDLLNEREFRGSLTGTNGFPPNLTPRVVVKQELIHIGCGGSVKNSWFTRWEGAISYTTMWKECTLCHKKFDIEEE